MIRDRVRALHATGERGSLMMGILFLVLAVTIVTTMLVSLTQYSVAASGDIGSRVVQTQAISVRSQLLGSLNSDDYRYADNMDDPMAGSFHSVDGCATSNGPKTTISSGMSNDTISVCGVKIEVSSSESPSVVNGSSDYEMSYAAHYTLTTTSPSNESIPGYSSKSFTAVVKGTCVVAGVTSTRGYLGCSANTPPDDRYYVWNLIGAS